MHLVKDDIVLRAIYNPVRATIKQDPVSADTDASRQMEGRTNHDPFLYYNGKSYRIHKSCISSQYIMIVLPLGFNDAGIVFTILLSKEDSTQSSGCEPAFCFIPHTMLVQRRLLVLTGIINQ